MLISNKFLVLCTYDYLPVLRKKISDYRKFIDSCRVYVRGGTGGLGLAKYNGIGGRGGNVYVVAKERATLKNLLRRNPQRRFCAVKGDDSSGRALQGAAGPPLEIEVPTGICVKTDFGTVLGELNKVDDRVLVARGGDGGSSVSNFVGRKGEALSINLDLKLISDIGFVGFPNAGKSTLLKALSNATPKIASYPFTTIQPQIGVMQYDDLRQISLADLPGLVEGAHVNVGMGHRFLKHVERTKLLAFVVDIFGFRLNVKQELRTPFENIVLLNKELEMYRQDLVDKPAILIVNKMDISGAEQLYESLVDRVKNMTDHLNEIDSTLRPERLIRFDDIIPISAKRRQNTEKLKLRFRELLDVYDDLRRQEFEDELAEKRLSALRTASSEHFGKELV